MDEPLEPFQVVGYYSQPYNKIVNPDRVWRVSKYFLRRWGPYLTPSRFWAIVGARQLAYWNDKCRWFTVYDRRFAKEAHLSTIHFRRLKSELDQPDQALSLFLSKKSLPENKKYHVVNGQTKPKPTTYLIRLDDPLTPADGLHLSHWLQKHHPQRRIKSIASLLTEARDLPRAELQAPTLAPHLANAPSEFKHLSVFDVVEQVYGTPIAQNEEIKEAANLLHIHLTAPDYYGKEYFRQQWLDVLKPGPAFLLTYLRSFCFHDEKNGELRNEVTFTRPDLANNLGVTTKTIVNWLKKIETAVSPQTLPPFISLIEQNRQSNNDVQYKYRIAMLEPLTKKDLLTFSENQKNHNNAISSSSDGKNDNHDFTLDHKTSPAKGKNDGHEFITQRNNDSHAVSNKPKLLSSPGKNDDHAKTQIEKMITGKRTIDETLEKKRASFKYYKTLFNSLDKDKNPLNTAVQPSAYWKIEKGGALKTFASAVCHDDLEILFDLLKIDSGGPVRKRLLFTGMSVTEIVAWYLYAICQNSLKKPPVNFTIARVLDCALPPEEFMKLANLSWELWRCYTCLLILHPAERDNFRDAPLFEIWFTQFKNFTLEALPFGVGVGISEFVSVFESSELHACESGHKPHNGSVIMQNNNKCAELWQPVLRELKISMAKATFNNLLHDAMLVQVDRLDSGEGESWVVTVKNEYAVDWLSRRLNKTVIEPVASAVHQRSICISYESLNSG